MPRKILALLAPTLLALGACQEPTDEPGDGENDPFATGKGDSVVDPASDEAKAVLLVVNDPELDVAEFDDDVRLDRRAAENIVAHRNGPDGAPGTTDDDLFDDLAELDEVGFVGQKALGALLKFAVENGYLDRVQGEPGGPAMTEVVFSPQPSETTHNARVAALIDDAKDTIDIAMYSYSSSTVRKALESAAARGVKIRFIFETAAEDRKLEGDALLDSASGQLEEVGIDVRGVNKIMHHKFMIIDGPRDDMNRAFTATIASGSANWSNSAGTRYDENTLFLRGHDEIALRLQKEFNHLWNHSRDLVAQDIPFVASTVEITDANITDGLDEHVFFTSDNFDVKDGSDTFSVTGRNTVSDQLIGAIQGAEKSILIASGHLRHRGVAEAIIAKVQQNPEMDIRIYLDAQEYISKTTHDQQVEDLEDCIAAAGSSESKIRSCMDKGFLFGFMVGEAGAHVRYKWYAYRWHFSYAAQMHHKYMVIDGDELWTGSFNLSDNAEHNTFENMMRFTGEANQGIVAEYTANFEQIWETGRADDLLGALRERISKDDVIPMVFDSMALEHSEVNSLKSLILDNCSQANSTDFRTHPENHLVCHRD